MRLNAFFRLLTSRRRSQSDPDLSRPCSDQFLPITRAASSSPLEDEQMNPPEMLGLENPVLGTTSAETWTRPVPQYSPELELMKTKLVAFEDATKQEKLTIEILGAHDVDRPTTVPDPEDQKTTWIEYKILPKTRKMTAFLWNITKGAHNIAEKTILETAVWIKFRAKYRILSLNLLVNVKEVQGSDHKNHSLSQNTTTRAKLNPSNHTF